MFAGSNLGERPEFKEQAIELGKMFVENDYELVYGGSCVGLMGEVANEVLRLGGRVTGVMPRGLFRGEIVHTGLTELIEVETMHERKAKWQSLRMLLLHYQADMERLKSYLKQYVGHKLVYIISQLVS